MAARVGRNTQTLHMPEASLDRIVRKLVPAEPSPLALRGLRNGPELAAWRRACGMTQADLACALGDGYSVRSLKRRERDVDALEPRFPCCAPPAPREQHEGPNRGTARE